MFYCVLSCFIGVLLVFYWCCIGVLLVFYWCFIGVLLVFYCRFGGDKTTIKHGTGAK
jgi:hypothetical protein